LVLNELQYIDFNSEFYDDQGIATKTTAESINNSIDNILFTTKGEKVGSPEFGSNIKRLLFEPMDTITEHLLKSDIVDNISKYEPRIEIGKVIITANPDSNYYTVTILYTIIRSPEAVNKYVSILKRI